MKTYSLRDIIGPIMIGPSSSHTAGALAISAMARRLMTAPPVSATFTLYGSFAYTGTGHGTDKALVAGILGLAADDERIRTSFELAREMGVDVQVLFDRDTEPDHPNTVDIHAVGSDGAAIDVRGISIGGGAAVITRIDDIDVNITGEHTSIVVEQNDVVGVLAHIAGVMADAHINIANARVYRKARHKVAFTVMEVDAPSVPDLAARLYANPDIRSVRIIPLAGDALSKNQNNAEGEDKGEGASVVDPQAAQADFERWDFASGEELLAICEREGLPISDVFLHRERALCAVRGDYYDIDAYLSRVLATMKAEARLPIVEPKRSVGGLIGGEAQLVASMAQTMGDWKASGAGAWLETVQAARDNNRFDVSSGAADAVDDARPSSAPAHTCAKLPSQNRAGKNTEGAKFSLLDPLSSSAVAFALATLETNASMGCIVATPTAGSAGVLPGVLLALQVHRNVSDGRIKQALATCAAIGSIIARNASVSGAEGGCQAEVGSAAAMAAAAAVELAGGAAVQSIYSAANTLMSLMGLVCDPVGGLVEVPCQKRNATAALVALASAQIALAGVNNAITFDDAVSAMDAVGRSLPFELRESALGGIAAVPSACQACAACS